MAIHTHDMLSLAMVIDGDFTCTREFVLAHTYIVFNCSRRVGARIHVKLVFFEDVAQEKMWDNW